MLQVFQATKDAVSSPVVRCFFHKPTNTCSYIVECPTTKKAAIVDSVLDYAINSGQVGTEYADAMVKEVEKEGLNVEWILDTHVHADHITGMAYLKTRLPSAKTAISQRISEVQKWWSREFEWHDFDCTGAQWDVLFADPAAESSSTQDVSRSAAELTLGELKIRPIPTPGHTPSCMSLLVGDSLFTGDAIFQPDFGTARCDFPGGSADDLYESISKTIYSLPDRCRIFVGHDYPPATRQVTFHTDIAAQKASNKYVTAETSKHDFVTARTTRDSQLDLPSLIYPALQFNINAGSLPAPLSSGKRFVKTPLRIPSSLEF